MHLFRSNPILCIILGFCLTLSSGPKLSAQCSECFDDTIWYYPYDPCENYLTVPWSSEISRNIVVVFIAVGLGCIAGMIAGNVASKNNNKKHHHHHGHHHAVRNSGFQIDF